MDDQEIIAPTETAEELAAEKEYTTEAKEDAIRESIIKEFEFDPNDEKDKARIDKAVKRELESRGKLSKAVGQKIKYRDVFTKAKGLIPPKPAPKKEGETEEDPIQAAFDKRDLEEMEYPDELKESIKKVAKTEGISVRQATKDPYIVSKIEAWKKEKGVDGAGLSRKDNTSGGGSSGDGDVDLTPPDVDVTTPEGRKEYDAWVDKMKKLGH